MVPPRVVVEDGMGGRRLARSFSRSAAAERLVRIYEFAVDTSPFKSRARTSRSSVRCALCCRIVQRDAHALGVGQGRVATTSRPTIRHHRHRTNLVRFASSIRPDMIFGKDTLLITQCVSDRHDQVAAKIVCGFATLVFDLVVTSVIAKLPILEFAIAI